MHGRIILDLEWVPQAGAEARVAVDTFTRLAPPFTGAQGVIDDTTRHDTTRRGAAPTTRRSSVTSAGCRFTRSRPSTPRPRARPVGAGRRVEKSTHVEDRTITTPDGEQTISLFAEDGAIGIGVLIDTAKRVFVLLERIRTHRNTDKAGYRWYSGYRLPEQCGGTIMIRLHGTDEDVKRRFNRTENIRQIPQGRPGLQAPLPPAQPRRVHQPGT